MIDPGKLHDLKAIGHHLLHDARKKGKGTAAPLAFMGVITVLMGATLLVQASRQHERER